MADNHFVANVTSEEKRQRRANNRRKTPPYVIRVQIPDRAGSPQWITGDLVDAAEGGIGVLLHTPLAVGATVIVRGKFKGNHVDAVSSASVMWCAEQPNGSFRAGLKLDETVNPEAAREQAPAKASGELDCYEVMQLSPNADADTIQRVYRMLAQRYHPDATQTGNAEMFLRLAEAHRILSDPERRAQYDARHRETKQLQWKIFDRAEADLGPEGEQRKRHGILEVLYLKALRDPDHGEMSIFDLEQLLGCPREHLEAAVWYLKGKGYARRGDNGRLAITVEGFDEVERHAHKLNPGHKLLPEPARV